MVRAFQRQFAHEAEQDGYELLITTDRNLRYEQNLANRKIAIIVLMTTS